MFTIRRELYEAYSEAMRQRFVDDLLVSVSKDYSAKFNKRTEEENRHSIEDLIEWAISYKIDEEEDVKNFVYLNYSDWMDNSKNDAKLEEIIESNLSVKEKILFIKENL